MTQRRGGSDLIGGISTLFEDVSETGVGGPLQFLCCAAGAAASQAETNMFTG